MTKTLGQVAEFLSGGTPRKGVSEFWGGSIPWYSAANMDKRFLGDTEVTISEAGLDAGSRIAPQGATLLLVRGSGLFNHIPICFCDSDVAFNQDVKAICAKPGNDPIFIHFWLESLRPKLKENLGVTGIGAGKFDLDYLKALPFPDFGEIEQGEIGFWASRFDRKIDLNRRMNETLESMARALFKDWFVDFGPTRAKMEGREPYLAQEIWGLFPDKLDDDGKPEGWSEKPLDEIAEFLNGLALQKFPASESEDSLPVIKIAELRGGISQKSNRASRQLPDKYIVKDGDFLFSWSGSLLAKFWTEGEGALNQHLFKVTSDRYPAWFFSHWVHHHLENFQMIAASKATTMGHIQRGHLKEAMTICPPDEALSTFGQTFSPLVKRSILNELEARSLAQTRDLLLPKLMSGEISVADAEQAVREAT